MIHDRYTIQGVNEMCEHLMDYKDKTDWRVDFYNLYDALLLTFESDEETLENLKDPNTAYQMVVEWMDVALMMGKEY